jgi:hypothetical protein
MYANLRWETWGKYPASHSHDPAFVKPCSLEAKVSMVLSLWWSWTQTLGAYQCGANLWHLVVFGEALAVLLSWSRTERHLKLDIFINSYTLVALWPWQIAELRKRSPSEKNAWCSQLLTYPTVETRTCDGLCLVVGLWIVAAQVPATPAVSTSFRPAARMLFFPVRRVVQPQCRRRIWAENSVATTLVSFNSSWLLS